MSKHLLFVLVCVPLWGGAQPAGVRRVLEAQEAAWNRADVAAFMAEGYWNCPDLLFVGSQGLTTGFDETLARYRTSYPDATAMGQLEFGLLRWVRLGPRHGLCIGTWKLTRTGNAESVDGHFSLVWRKTWKGWRIIADHSS